MYSGKKIVKAGEILIKEEFGTEEYSGALDVLSYWRLSHDKALTRALNLIEPIAKSHDGDVYTAKRLKRSESIREKLKRYSGMKLKNMQDIGGCRIVVSNEKKLRQIVRSLKKLKEFRSTKDRRLRHDDYIKRPQRDGYRSYHLVGVFKNNNNEDRRIEVQVRTRVQHYWATALEIVDLFTGQSLKIGLGNEDWESFFVNVSEQFAVMEGIYRFEDMSFEERHDAYMALLSQNRDYYESFERTKLLVNKLRAVERFEAFASSVHVLDELVLEKKDGYALIEINVDAKTIKPILFNENETGLAEFEYVKAEKQTAGNPNLFVALVSTDAIGGVKTAYPNFFADSTKFVEYLQIITETVLIEKDTFWNRWIRRYKAT